MNKRRGFLTSLFGVGVGVALAEKEPIKVEPPPVDPFVLQLQKEIEELKARQVAPTPVMHGSSYTVNDGINCSYAPQYYSVPINFKREM